VPPDAKICPSCKTYLNWRRYISLGQTNLALLVSLFAVLTTLVTVGLPMLHKMASDISVLLDSASDDQAVFIARNNGRSGGLVHMGRFGIKIIKSGEELFFELNKKERFFIEAGKEQTITVKYANKGNDVYLCDRLFTQKFFDDYGKLSSLNATYTNPSGAGINDRFSRMNQGLICTIVGGQKSFYNSPTLDEDNITITRSCSDIEWVRSCLVRAESSFDQ
jgi:hypothetical protein